MNEENNLNNNQNDEKDLSDKVIESVENFINTTDHETDYEKGERSKYKTEAILSYIPFIPLYFAFTSKHKNSKYLTFHVNQGMIVTFAWIFSIIISLLLSSIFKRDSMIINDIPGWVSFVSYLLYSLSFLLTLFGSINTINDSSKELPLLGKFKIIK